MLWVSAGFQPGLTLEFPKELSNLAHELPFVPVSWLLASPILLVSYVLGAGTTSVATVSFFEGRDCDLYLFASSTQAPHFH